MVFQKLSSAMPALLLLLLALAPSVAATGPADPYYCDQATAPPCTPPATWDTCHSGTGCTVTSADGWAFHNDDGFERSIWAVNQNTGRVDYWQCIEGGLYSGNPAGPGGGQGSTDGEVRNAAGTMVSWLGDFYSGSTSYSFEWRVGCWAPCDPFDGDVCIPMPFPDRIDIVNQ